MRVCVLIAIVVVALRWIDDLQCQVRELNDVVENVNCECNEIVFDVIIAGSFRAYQLSGGENNNVEYQRFWVYM